MKSDVNRKTHNHLVVDLPAHVTNEVIKMYFNMGYEVILKLEDGINLQVNTYIKDNKNEK